MCIVGEVKNIFEGNVKDHSGPYDGVTMGVGCWKYSFRQSATHLHVKVGPPPRNLALFIVVSRVVRVPFNSLFYKKLLSLLSLDN